MNKEFEEWLDNQLYLAAATIEYGVLYKVYIKYHHIEPNLKKIEENIMLRYAAKKYVPSNQR